MNGQRIIEAIRAASFEPLGWFAPNDLDGVKLLIVIGNAGPAMFDRFERERNGATMDEWTKATINPLALTLSARAAYPFDRPYPPFQQWARAAGAGHASPLGLNIHATFGLWQAYRAALLFSDTLDLPHHDAGPHPCQSCVKKPCLHTCPVSAFDGQHYDIAACAHHLYGENSCMENGCLARLACPVGREFRYARPQMQFHMNAFKAAHPVTT